MVRYGNEPPVFIVYQMDMTAGLPYGFKAKMSEYFDYFMS
jgi:hypothetical protein